MKTRSLLLPIFIFSIQLSLHFSDAEPEAVVDINGEELEEGSEYYITPVIPQAGGGLNVASPGGFIPCPLAVVQEPPFQRGLPLTFHPAFPNDTVITTSTYLNIKISAFTYCFLSTTVWTVARDEATGVDFIQTGGIEGNPGPETSENWFKIQKYDYPGGRPVHYFYKFVFCPTDFKSSAEVVCRDVGVYDEWDRRRLEVTDEDGPLLFNFEKAS